MTRFGIAFALLIGVLVALYVPPAMRQFAQQLRGHDVAAAGDHKPFHAETISRGAR